MNAKSVSQKLHLAIVIVGIAFIVIFTLQNTEIVTVHFLIWRLEMSRVILISVLLLVGFLLGYVFRSRRRL